MKKSTASSGTLPLKKSDAEKSGKQKRVCCFTLIELLVGAVCKVSFLPLHHLKKNYKKYTSLRPSGRTSRFFCDLAGNGNRKKSSSHLHIFTRSAFTLIELLVVVAIMAILAGMLLPTLSKAKEAGKKIACNNKLRTLLTYSALYSNTFNDFIPHVVGNAESLNWATYKEKYNNNIYTSGIPYMLERGWLNAVPGKESPYMCPSQTYSANLTASMPDYHDNYMGRLSYGWNRNFNSGYLKQNIRLGSIKKPSQVFVLIETRRMPGSSRSNVWEALKNYPDNYTYGQRHNKSGHIGFFDGHTTSWKGRDPEKAKVALWEDK